MGLGRIGLALAAALLAAGCAGSPARLGMLSDDELTGQSVPDLIHAWRYTGNDRYRTALRQLNVFTDAEWPLIDAQMVMIGSRVEVLYAAWGRPQRENETISSAGRRVQHVYGLRQYAYSENGIVTAIQR